MDVSVKHFESTVDTYALTQRRINVAISIYKNEGGDWTAQPPGTGRQGKVQKKSQGILPWWL